MRTKRHILVDTPGLPSANRVEAADVSDRRAGALLLMPTVRSKWGEVHTELRLLVGG